MKSDRRQVVSELCGLNEKSGDFVPSGGMWGEGRVKWRESFSLWQRNSFTPDLKSICLLTRNWLHPNMKNEIYIVCVNQQFALICTWFVSNLLIVKLCVICKWVESWNPGFKFIHFDNLILLAGAAFSHTIWVHWGSPFMKGLQEGPVSFYCYCPTVDWTALAMTSFKILLRYLDYSSVIYLYDLWSIYRWDWPVQLIITLRYLKYR